MLFELLEAASLETVLDDEAPLDSLDAEPAVPILLSDEASLELFDELLACELEDSKAFVFLEDFDELSADF